MLAVSGLSGFALAGITNRLAFWDLAAKRKINKLKAAGPLAVIVSFSHDGPEQSSIINRICRIHKTRLS